MNEADTDIVDGPKDAKPWLQMLRDAETSEQLYHDKVEQIEKLFASLSGQSENLSDRQFRLFWSNMEVLGPTIYARPPQPVVTSRFKDRKPLPRKTADILERALRADVEIDDLHDDLTLVRDDLLLGNRGAGWISLVRDNMGLRVKFERLHRLDFRHEPARRWKGECGWVARRAFMTKDELKERFGNDLPRMEFKQHRLGRSDNESGDGKEEKKAEVWELWHKRKNLVVFVAMGSEEILEQRKPMYDLQRFFPCPRPAYGVLEAGTLKPVPDYYQYRDQLEEINTLTEKIHALSEGLRMAGFYAAGTTDIGEAVEILLAQHDSRATMVPIKNMAALGNTSLKDAVVWLPVREVAETIRHCIELRQQTIRDVYEITGLSDIMRGETEASETATAQQLKAEFGSIRVRKRQEEMARFARDVMRLKSEIMAEQFPIADLLHMAQVDDLPSMQEIGQKLWGAVQSGQLPYQHFERAMQQAQQRTVTQEQVEQLLRDQRTRPFVLEIETDSTININESAEKQSRMEFMGAFGEFVSTVVPLVQQAPQLAELSAEALRFFASAYRIDRSMDEAIDKFAEAMMQPQGGQGAEQQAQAQADQAKAQAEQMKAQGEQQRVQGQMQVEQLRQQGDAAKAQADMMKTQGQIALTREKMTAQAQGAAMQQRAGNGN